MKSEGKHPHLLQREMRRITALCGTHYRLVKNQLDFYSPEFEGIKNSAGLNRFILSAKQWIERTLPHSY